MSDEPPDFDDMFRELESDFWDVDTSQEEAYAEWLEYAPMHELVRELARVNSELGRLGEVLFPTTERGHELHSKHTALKMQFNKRGQ